MPKDLFENAGKEIKTIAKAIATRILVMYALAAVGVAVAGCYLLSEQSVFGLLLIVAAIAVIAYGYSKSRTEVLLLYAYGEITDRLISIESNINGKHNPNPKRHIPNPKPPIPTPSVEESHIHTGPWECPFCGNRNGKESNYCESCGMEDTEF